jgi:hypothetical protein
MLVDPRSPRRALAAPTGGARGESDAGDLIPGTGGLRKLRWAVPGRGKRGGMRIIYYWVMPKDQIFMLLAYRKNQQDDLTAEQKRLLVKLVMKELENG